MVFYSLFASKTNIETDIVEAWGWTWTARKIDNRSEILADLANNVEI